nr:MAG TPA: Rad50 zinc hook motif [Caudoviricetes sp.]
MGLHLMGYGTNYITYNQKDKKYRLFYECEDITYSGATLDISYCPVCGRKLKDA